VKLPRREGGAALSFENTMKRILIAEDDRALGYLLGNMLQTAGFSVVVATNGTEALQFLRRNRFDLVLLDLGLPGIGGLEILARLRKFKTRPLVVVMTADTASETALCAARAQVYQYVRKPFEPRAMIKLVERALAAPPVALEIKVLSARPEWVELLVPCQIEAVERIQSFLMGLDTDFGDEVRESVGQAFRELLLNAIEWGGKLDPRRRVRIAYLRGRRMVLYRIADPGSGFRLESLRHAAVANPPDKPYAHMQVRAEKGLRAGGFGLLMVRQMVDELIYNEARNEVLFVKYLD